MNFKKEWKWLAGFVAGFFIFYFLPIESVRFKGAITEALALGKWYTREHIILCLAPALFIAGAISAFVSQASVMKYFGANAKKILSYSVASVSGTILAVCSCTVLPLFAGIYKRGAGLGPAIAFLYSGPAINILAIVLTAKVLGFQLGLARAIGAIVFSVVIGLLMHFIFAKEERAKARIKKDMPVSEAERPLYQTILYFVSMVAILVFANWGKSDSSAEFFYYIYTFKWIITSIFAIALDLILIFWFKANILKISIASAFAFILALIFRDMPVISFAGGFVGLSWALAADKNGLGDWFFYSWDLAKQVFPLLIAGVLVSGFFLGRPGHEGIIPSNWIQMAVGGNSFSANFFSSIVGAFMYFATLTEIPILQGLIGAGMGKGPSLALLLAGPALSLPNMLVLRQIMGIKKTAVFVILVIVMATLTGITYGKFV